MKAKLNKQSGGVVLELDKRDEPLMAAAAEGPFRLNRILVPVDFSTCSTKALQYALPLARQHNATLALLYVVPTPYGYGEYSSIDLSALELDMRTAGKKELEKLAALHIRDQVPFEIVLRTGSPKIEISEFARTLPADLIVISTHGHTGFKHVLLGSVAEHVVRHAPCPVLVLKEQEKEFLRN